MQDYFCDCIIFGGGVCGLWVDAYLQEKGYNTLLLENNVIGGEQSSLSQGILHRGMKYALSKKATGISKLLQESTKIWDDALLGKYPVNLKKVEIYASKQLIWSEPKLLASFFSKSAQKLFFSEIQKLKINELPKWLAHKPKNIFWLQEKVINAYSMAENFYNKYKEHYYTYQWEKKNITLKRQKKLIGIFFKKENFTLWTQKVILASGKGNSSLADFLQTPTPMQIRPLRMLAIEHSSLPPIYGHCISTSSKPLFTISSHLKKNKKMLWYLGGKIAEEKEWSLQQITNIIQKNIRVDFLNAKWLFLEVDRAEPYQKSGNLPDEPFVMEKKDTIICFPVKLAFAPLVALETEKILKKLAIKPSFLNKKRIPLKKAELRKPFYETLWQKQQ